MLAVSLIFESSFLNLEHSFNIPRQWGYVNHRIDTRGIVHTMSLLKVYLGYIAIGVLWWMGSQILEKWTSFFLHDVTLANNQGSRILIQRLEGENSVYVTYAVYGTSNYIHPWAESGVGWRKFINYASPILVWTSNVEESQCDFITTFEKKNENDFSTNLLCRKIVSGLYVSKTLWTATNKFPRLPYFIRPVNCRQVD